MKYLIKIKLPLYKSPDWEEKDVEVWHRYQLPFFGWIIDRPYDNQFEIRISKDCVEFKNPEDKETLIKNAIIMDIIQ